MNHSTPDLPWSASLTEAGHALRAGHCSSEQLVARCLSRIEAFDGQLHAFVEVYRDEALTAARAMDGLFAAGVRLSPLQGLPIAVKDLFEIEGRRITGGSIAEPARVSTITATAVQRLREAGAVIIGKTHTVEFAFGGWGTNAVMGTPWNPWDLQTHRVPGGSSSGSAVAVAAGMAAAALGTDTGGSVRIPAGMCGLVGLKTTGGVISRVGLLDLCPTHDTVGTLCRSAEDAALLFDVLTGRDRYEAAAWPNGEDAVSPRIAGPLEGLRGLRAWVLPAAERAQIEPAVLAAYDTALATLAAQGVQRVDARLPQTFAHYMTIAGELMSAEGYAHLGPLFEREDLRFDPHVRRRVLAGRDISAAGYVRLRRERQLAQEAMAQAMEQVDVCLFPTNPITAIPVADVDELRTPLSLLGRFVNLLNLCSVAVPVGLSPSGLPVSMQIIGRPHAEALVLRLAHAYQQVSDWHRLTPKGLDR
jgi:aspartyl-tRNA(Asn)/glutamyl-tRNA(Gln) amidotransferase subunit A